MAVLSKLRKFVKSCRIGRFKAYELHWDKFTISQAQPDDSDTWSISSTVQAEKGSVASFDNDKSNILSPDTQLSSRVYSVSPIRQSDRANLLFGAGGNLLSELDSACDNDNTASSLDEYLNAELAWRSRPSVQSQSYVAGLREGERQVQLFVEERNKNGPFLAKTKSINTAESMPSLDTNLSSRDTKSAVSYSDRFEMEFGIRPPSGPQLSPMTPFPSIEEVIYTKPWVNAPCEEEGEDFESAKMELPYFGDSRRRAGTMDLSCNDLAIDGEEDLNLVEVEENQRLHEIEEPPTLSDTEDDRSLDEMDSDDPDSFWMSDYSDNITLLDEEHPLLHSFREPLAQRLLSEFESRRMHRTMDSGERETTESTKGQNFIETTSTSTSSSNQQQNKESSKKTRKFSDDEEDGESSNESQPPRKRARIKQGKTRPSLLACPFCKKDPLRYSSCYRQTLTKISYIKQHLSRHHRLPIYCPVCMAIFETEEDRDVHSRARTCDEQPIIQFEGVSESQKKQLSKRVPPKMSESDQWYTIFDILFPGHQPRPKSPYIDSNLSEELSAFRDFATNQGSGIMIGVLRERAFIPPDAPEMPALLDVAISDGLQAIFERWTGSNTSALQPGVGSGALSTRDISEQDGRSSSNTLVDDSNLDKEEEPVENTGTPIFNPALLDENGSPKLQFDDLGLDPSWNLFMNDR